jgi:polyisoprenoid-binding protein YceI
MNDTLISKPRRRLKLWHVIVAVVAASVAAIAATYLLFFTDDSPPPLTLSTPASTPATTPATSGATATTTAASGATATTVAPATGSGLAGEWAIGASSTAGYRVREKLAQLPAQSDAVGRTSAITGTIQVTSSGSQVVVADGAKFQVDVTKLSSNESMRDNRIRTMGLESNRYPTATFVSTAPIQLGATAASGAATKTEVTGDLTIHGVTKRVTIPLDTQMNGGRIEVVGSLSFPFSDFGMTAPSIGGFVTVENNATVEFQLFFDKK